MTGKQVIGRTLLLVAVVAVMGSASGRGGLQGEFKRLFDGRTLNGWRGDPAVWSVEDGAITGRSPAGRLKNTFLIYAESFRDFEIRFKYRFLTPEGNSGFQYRSQVLSEEDFSVTGYQANVVTADAGERFAMLWDEEGRGLLAHLGQKVYLTGGPSGLNRSVQGQVNSPAEILEAVRSFPDWNECVIIAYGNRLLNAVNGLLATDVVDDDDGGRDMEGLLALQIHAGRSMAVQFKDIEIMELETAPEITSRFGTVPPDSPGLAAAAPPATPGPAAREGGVVYAERCAKCHDSGQEEVPLTQTIATRPRDLIIRSMTTGSMAFQAFGLTDSEIEAVAAYLGDLCIAIRKSECPDQPSSE